MVAAMGKTAPQIIQERADHTRPNMGLRTWKGKIVQKGDVTIAKNYLDEGEIDELNRIVVMFLDHAEDQTRRRTSIYMAEWPQKLDAFLAFNERRVLPGTGGARREDADVQLPFIEQLLSMLLAAPGRHAPPTPTWAHAFPPRPCRPGAHRRIRPGPVTRQ